MANPVERANLPGAIAAASSRAIIAATEESGDASVVLAGLAVALAAAAQYYKEPLDKTVLRLRAAAEIVDLAKVTTAALANGRSN